MAKYELHVLSNGKMDITTFSSVVEVIHPYVSSIHIREKHRAEAELNEWVTTLISLGVPKEKLTINSHYAMAGERGLGGVQLPGDGPPPLEVKRNYPWLNVGCSIHSVDEAIVKQDEGADYLIFGNVYETDCKPGLNGKGLILLQEVAQAVSIPVVAIGGLTPENTQDVLKTGASGIAVMSGVMEATDPFKQACQFQTMLQGDE